MTDLRIGHGYDVHRLTEGRRLVLGGVDVPYDRGLLGHSDADVLTHAVMDALCGAAKLGDIGRLFPDSDPAYAGISSLALLEQVAAQLKAGGWAVVNIDATLVAQAPKVGPYRREMEANLAAALGVEADRVNVRPPRRSGWASPGTAPAWRPTRWRCWSGSPEKRTRPRARPFCTSIPLAHTMGREEECLWSTI